MCFVFAYLFHLYRLYYPISQNVDCTTRFQTKPIVVLYSFWFQSFFLKAHCIVCALLLLQLSVLLCVHLEQQSEKFVMLGFFPILAKSVFSTKFDPCNHDQLIILSWVKKVNFINFSSQILSILDSNFFPDGSITNNMTPILFHKNCIFFIPI